VALANRLLAWLNRLPAEARRHLRRPGSIAVWVGVPLLLCIWVGWAIYVGTSNGWTAALGVLITWPLLAALASLLAFATVGIHRLTQRGQPAAGLPGIAGAGAPPKLPKGHDSVTTLTFPS